MKEKIEEQKGILPLEIWLTMAEAPRYTPLWIRYASKQGQTRVISPENKKAFILEDIKDPSEYYIVTVDNFPISRKYSLIED